MKILERIKLNQDLDNELFIQLNTQLQDDHPKIYWRVNDVYEQVAANISQIEWYSLRPIQ